MKNLYLIACISEDRGLGYAGDLLWHIKEDMQFFRTTTLGSTVVMGRKTYASIGKPLPGRQNVVLSRHEIDSTADNLTVYHDPAALTQFLDSLDTPKFVIGGASLYQMYIDQADKLYLTEVAASRPADTFFPEFDKSRFTRTVLKSGLASNIKYEIVEYTRREI